MKEKLTKIDSMTAKKTDFDVVVATFEALLKKERAHKRFFEEWAKSFNYNGTSDVFYAWRNSVRLDTANEWVPRAFYWISTKEGHKYWNKIHEKWVEWIDANLKK